MQTLPPGLPRKLWDTNRTTATAMLCQSPVLTLFSLALKVTAEEKPKGDVKAPSLTDRLPQCIPLAPTWGAGL